MIVWDSMISGAALFGSWQIWVAVLCQVVAIFGPTVTGALIVYCTDVFGACEKGEVIGGILGVLSKPLGLLVVGATVVWLMPLLLGQQQAMPIAQVLQLWWPIVKGVLLALVIALCLSFIPVFGPMLVDSIVVGQALIQVVVFRYLLLNIVSQLSLVPASAPPGVGIVALFVACGIVMGLVVTVLPIWLYAQWRERRASLYGYWHHADDDDVGTSLVATGIVVVGMAVSYWPFLAYSQYVRMSMGL